MMEDMTMDQLLDFLHLTKKHMRALREFTQDGDGARAEYIEGLEVQFVEISEEIARRLH